jgi:hypothetical protein
VTRFLYICDMNCANGVSWIAGQTGLNIAAVTYETTDDTLAKERTWV